MIIYGLLSALELVVAARVYSAPAAAGMCLLLLRLRCRRFGNFSSGCCSPPEVAYYASISFGSIPFLLQTYNGCQLMDLIKRRNAERPSFITESYFHPDITIFIYTFFCTSGDI
jgi:hypothetical protein